MKSILLLLLFCLTSPLAAQAEVLQLDNAQLQQLLEQKVPIIDIRRPEEWQQTGIVAGSHLLTFFDAAGNYDARAWLAKLEPIAGKEDPLILICRTGNRTGMVARFLDEQLGYQKVYNVTRGITHWIAEQNPTVAP